MVNHDAPSTLETLNENDLNNQASNEKLDLESRLAKVTDKPDDEKMIIIDHFLSNLANEINNLNLTDNSELNLMAKKAQQMSTSGEYDFIHVDSNNKIDQNNDLNLDTNEFVNENDVESLNNENLKSIDLELQLDDLKDNETKYLTNGHHSLNESINLGSYSENDKAHPMSTSRAEYDFLEESNNKIDRASDLKSEINANLNENDLSDKSSNENTVISDNSLSLSCFTNDTTNLSDVNLLEESSLIDTQQKDLEVQKTAEPKNESN